MKAQPLRRQVLLSTTVLVGVLTAYGRSAYAACVSTLPDPPNVFVCTGTETTQQTITVDNAQVTTQPGFSVNTIDPVAVNIVAAGDLSYIETDTEPLNVLNGGTSGIYIHSSGDAGMIPGSITVETNGTVTGGDWGIRAENLGTGGVDITANGAVTGTSSRGIDVINFGTDLSITTEGVSGGSTGIYARNRGAGVLDITAYGEVSGTSDHGIFARSYNIVGTDLTITAEGVRGGSTGIYAHSYGAGALTITANGAVAGTSAYGIYARNRIADGTDLSITAEGVSGGRYGIFARNNGTGALTITAYGEVKGGSEGGIYAWNENAAGTGDVSVTAEGVTGGTSGIHASNAGEGKLDIKATGDVTGGTTGNGIYARNNNADGTDLTITAKGVRGGGYGIAAYNFGSGATDVTTKGDVAGGTQDGIRVHALGSSTIDAEGEVTGGGYGIRARTYGAGALTVTAKGDVAGGTRDGIFAVSNSAASTTLTVTTAGVSGRSGIFARNNGTGDLTITTKGEVLGRTNDGIRALHGGAGAIAITVEADSSVTSNGGDADDFAIQTDYGAANVWVAGSLNGGGGGAVQFDQTGDFDNRLALQTSASVNGTVFGGIGAGTDTLALQGTGQGSFNVAQLIDFESGEKTGSSHWELTGTNAGIDNFAVNGGLLSVNGALPNAAFTVNGGTLGGSGIVGSTTVANGGVFAPGNSIGAMTVNGAFTLNPGAVFEVEVNAAGQGDKVVVTGTVNLTGATLRVLAEPGKYKVKTDYLIVDNDGADAVSSKFSKVTTNFAFLTPLVDYKAGDGNDVVLTLINTTSDFCSVATTRNQCNVAHALDKFPTDDPLFLAVLLQTAEGARQAFDALSGEIHATLPGILADESRYVREAVLGRLMQATYTTGLGRIGALGAAGPQVASLDAQAMALGYADGAVEPAPNYGPALAFWTRAFGAWGDFDASFNAAAADRTLGGFVSGMDARVAGSWRLGLAAGFSESDVSVGARHSSAEVETVHFAAYAGGMVGPFALRGGGAFAWNDIDTTRAVIFPGFFEREEASYDADTGQLFGEIAYPMGSSRLSVEPFAGLAYVSLDAGSFRERGNLAALTGRGTDEDIGYSALGIRAATTLHLGSTIVIPKASAAWQHAFETVIPEAALAFASTGIGFDVKGVPLARDSLLIEAGLDLNLSPTATLGVSYSGQIASEVTDNAVKGRFTWLF